MAEDMGDITCPRFMSPSPFHVSDDVPNSMEDRIRRVGRFEKAK